MAAGKIKIYRYKHMIYDGRKKEEEPELYYETWCDIGSLYGQELYKALDIRLENIVIFEVRYCRKIREIQGHLKEYFVEYNGEKYNIYAIDFRKNEKQYVQLKANRTD